MAIQIKAIEDYYTVVLFTMMFKVVVSFEYVDEIPMWSHTHDS